MKAGKLTVTKDFTKEFMNAAVALKNKQVLVGIPETEGSREDDSKSSETISNAAILAINHFGSPARNIPASPVLEIGIKNAQDDLIDQFKKAATETLSQGKDAVDTYFNRAGIIASQACKKVINDQDGIQAPASSTLKNRKSRGFKGEKRLLVTGQVRNAITWVIRSK